MAKDKQRETLVSAARDAETTPTEHALKLLARGISSVRTSDRAQAAKRRAELIRVAQDRPLGGWRKTVGSSLGPLIRRIVDVDPASSREQQNHDNSAVLDIGIRQHFADLRSMIAHAGTATKPQPLSELAIDLETIRAVIRTYDALSTAAYLHHYEPNIVTPNDRAQMRIDVEGTMRSLVGDRIAPERLIAILDHCLHEDPVLGTHPNPLNYALRLAQVRYEQTSAPVDPVMRDRERRWEVAREWSRLHHRLNDLRPVQSTVRGEEFEDIEAARQSMKVLGARLAKLDVRLPPSVSVSADRLGLPFFRLPKPASVEPTSQTSRSVPRRAQQPRESPEHPSRAQEGPARQFESPSADRASSGQQRADNADHPPHDDEPELRMRPRQRQTYDYGVDAPRAPRPPSTEFDRPPTADAAPPRAWTTADAPPRHGNTTASREAGGRHETSGRHEAGGRHEAEGRHETGGRDEAEGRHETGGRDEAEGRHELGGRREFQQDRPDKATPPTKSLRRRRVSTPLRTGAVSPAEGPPQPNTGEPTATPEPATDVSRSRRVEPSETETHGLDLNL